MRRSDQRRAAVWALYQHELTGGQLEQLLGGGAHVFTRALAQATWERAAELDGVIARHSHGWTVDRIAALERNILRVALLEMRHPEAVPGDVAIPPEGAIDEAVQTAKVFCAAEAPAFVNGILDAALRELRDNDASRAGASAPSP